MLMNKVLIVDDDEGIRFVLREFLRKNGFLPLEAQSGLDAVEIFRKESPHAVLLDLKMPGIDGIETLGRLQKIDSGVPVIIVTAFGDIRSAVETTRLGAYDFVTKPPDFDRLMLTVKRAVERQDLERKVRRLSEEVESSLEWTFGKSEKIRGVIEQIHQVAQCDFSVIIQGETGTGKSTLASVIHNLSARRKGPFVSVDMGAIPDTLVESELFGHEKGAFTGAERKKQGYFESANQGTILIDELQNIPLHAQARLLKAVDEKKIHSLGGSSSTDIDVRFIGATNIDIKESVREKRFREDLFFRLGEVIISVPPLRERVDDIPFFAQKFLHLACTELNRPMPRISEETVEILRRHAWPGNVRELKNVIRRAALFSNEETIAPAHIDFLIQHADSQQLPAFAQFPFVTIRDAEKAAIGQALGITSGNKSKAAALLQIDYKTLLKKIKQYGQNPVE